MTLLNKIQKQNLEKTIGIRIRQTDVTHIVRTHTEGSNKTHTTTLELSEDGTKWVIQTVQGNLVQLNNYKKWKEEVKK